MALRIPMPEDLECLARANHFEQRVDWETL